MRSLWRVCALLLLVPFAPTFTQAAWAPGGTRIAEGLPFVMTASGPDRVVVAWVRWEVNPGVGVHGEVLASAWSADGDPAPGWPAGGARVSNLSGRKGELAIVEDGAGGIFVAWRNRQDLSSAVYLQHLTAAGEVATGWDRDGMLLGPSFDPPVLAADRNGGVYVGWQQHGVGAHLQHVDGTGARSPGWPVEGITFPSSDISAPVALLVDSERRVFTCTFTYDFYGSGPQTLTVHRLNDDGTLDPAWPEAGATLGSWTIGGPTWLAPDGRGGVFTMWQDGPCADCLVGPRQYASRVLGEGIPDGGWSSGREGLSVAPDGTGGMLIGLISEGRPSVQRTDAAGAAMPGWASGGNRATSEYYPHAQVMVTGDGQGGAYAAWSGGSGLLASHLDRSGQLVPGWPPTGSRFGNGGWGSYLQLLTLPSGVAIAQWARGGTSDEPWAGYITALQPGEPGPFIDLGPPRLQVVENPARGPIVAMVNIPNGGTGQLELVDLSGRRVESQSVSLPVLGQSRLLFNQAGTLASGVYWIRLTQGGRVASKKVALLE